MTDAPSDPSELADRIDSRPDDQVGSSDDDDQLDTAPGPGEPPVDDAPGEQEDG